ncbi:MAG: hypothetical protein UIM24_05490 [Clostridia bacterium]|nr:hypothetical protein [Clostridia bacterium]
MNEEFLSGLGLDEETSNLIIQQYKDEKLQEKVATELKMAGTVDEAVAKTMLDMDGLTDENVKEKIGQLKEKHPYLFKNTQPRIISAAEGKSSVDKGEFSKMSYRERLELFKKNPDTYKRLVE